MINLNMFSMKFWFSLSLLCLTLAARAGDPALVYIRTYSDIVVKEMQRTGIPASIKMAQALLESEVGKSPLAARRNASDPVPQPMSRTTSLGFIRARVMAILRSNAAGSPTG